ncbi:MAG: redoxin domain-containing protein, partial [Bacteroidales bacterium]
MKLQWCSGMLLFILYFPSLLYSQKPAARIDFEIRGLSNSFLLFGVEYLDRQVILDTVRLNASGEGAYESHVRLRPGIYVVSFPNQKYFELLIEEEQFFSIYTDTAGIYENLAIVGAEQPALFLRYQKLIGEVEKHKSVADSTIRLQNQMRLKAFKDSVVTHKPSSLLAAYIHLHDLNRSAKAKPRELTQASFIRQQQEREKAFMNDFPFNDNRLIHSRLLFEQLSFFFNIFISQHPDTLIARMDWFLTKARQNEEMYKYLLAFFNQNYRHARTPAYEQVYVYLAENYYLNGKAPWADARFIALLQKKIEQLKPSARGAKVANLQLLLSDEKTVRLYDYSAKNIILFFWDPDCDICQKAFIQLSEKTQKFPRKDLLVLAIYVHSNKNPWIEFIGKH